MAYKKGYLRIKKMVSNRSKLRIDSKFLIFIFLICFVLICIVSLGVSFDQEGNMITIRTIFSSILGFILENVSKPKDEPTKETEILPNIKQENVEQENIEQSKEIKEIEEEPMLECRIIIMGHIAIFAIIILVIGVILDVPQNNQSLILLKNTAFASVGFLISATKTHMTNK